MDTLKACYMHVWKCHNETHQYVLIGIFLKSSILRGLGAECFFCCCSCFVFVLFQQYQGLSLVSLPVGCIPTPFILRQGLTKLPRLAWNMLSFCLSLLSCQDCRYVPPKNFFFFFFLFCSDRDQAQDLMHIQETLPLSYISSPSFSFLFFSGLGMKPSISHILGTHSPTEVHPLSYVGIIS